MDLRQSIIDEIISLAKMHGIEKVVLFGSRAREDNHERSDIDLAIKGGNIARFRTEIDDYVRTLLLFDVVDLESQISEGLRKSIETEGVTLYDKHEKI